MKNAICAIFKNEAPYLREWVQFHRLQGFERFHLYNNESTDDWMPELWDLISSGVVTIHDWSGKAQQIPAYKDFISKGAVLFFQVLGYAFLVTKRKPIFFIFFL